MAATSATVDAKSTATSIPSPKNQISSHRLPRGAPLPTSRQLSEERKRRFFKRVDNNRKERHFDKRADDMMRSTHVQERDEWLAEMARAASTLPQEQPDSDEDESMLLHDHGLADIPPDIEDPKRLGPDDLAAISSWSDQKRANDPMDTQSEDHFGSDDDDNEELAMLMSRIAEQCERTNPAHATCQEQGDGMDTT